MDTLKTISLAFIPLGFLGGLVQGSIAIAILSPIFWGAIYFWASRKTNTM